MYRFNNGRGAVVCDICRIIYDADIGYETYKEAYRKNKKENEKDLCWRCKNNIKKEDCENGNRPVC